MHLFPKPKKITESTSEFIFGKNMTLTIGEAFITDDQVKLFRELYENFTCGVGVLNFNITKCDVGCAVLAAEKSDLIEAGLDGYEYSLNITDDRAVLRFTDSASFAHAFCTMLSVIEARSIGGEIKFTLPVAVIKDRPTMKFRGIHICVFPETRYVMLRKFIRLAGFAKYTHIVIEFWGMYRYKCCEYLSQKHAFTNAQVKTLVCEANALGVEMIPMLNSLGHASQNRAIYCKHVTLDNNPLLAPYFEPDGWTWNLLNPDTLALLKQMRAELMEACGNGRYFHIGCDESFPYGSSRLFNGHDKYDVLVDYINGIVGEMKDNGRRVMMWGDQLLYPQEGWAPSPANIAYAESQESADKLLRGLDKSIVITDWEYYAREEVMPTSKLLREKGFDVVIAPFNSDSGTKVCVRNIVEQNYEGMLQTTWHVMHGDDTRLILRGGDLAWNGKPDYTKMDSEFMMFETASYLRRLLPSNGVYEDSGLRERDIVT